MIVIAIVCCVASNFKQCEASDITINTRAAMRVTYLMLWVNCGYLTAPWSWKKPVLRFGDNKNTCLGHDRVELSRGSFSNE